MTASAPQSLPDWIRDSLTGPMTARPSAPMGSAAKPALPLEGLFADLAQAAWERLPETICQHADWQASAHADVQTALVKRLGDLFRPVLSENLTVCRQAWTAHNVSGDLDALWLQAMRGTSWTKSGWAKLFALRLEMPRLLHLVLSQWQGAVIDLVTAYGADRSALADALCGGVDPGPCIGLTWGLSDPHGHGRGVALLSLRDYPDGLVYKPRPMALDAAMAGVIGLLNGDPNAPTHLKMPAVLDRGAYGWAERIQPRPCNGSEDIPLFYRRAGALLALLHSLRTTDFHAENIIAEAATPVSVDLETLWHPLLSGVQTGDAARGASGELDSKVRRAISRSLPATHYLSVAWNKAPDAGGVGGLDGLKTNELVENGVSGTHLPRLADGQIIDPSDHVDTILEGFRAYSAFLAAHPALAPAPEDPDGPPQALRGLPARMLVRHTGSYLARLDEISRPLALVSPEAFGTALAAPFPDRAFDPTAPAAPALWQAEQKALRRMDVPAFYWRIGQPDAGIREADGTAIPELTPMVETGRSGPGDRLDPEGAARVARAVLSLRFEKPITNLGGPALTSGPAASLDPAAALEAAEQIGAALEAVALRSGSGSEARADWVGIILRGKGADVGMPELELYTGLPGVLWFLSALAQRTGAS
ncbi:MAG: type 2 lanthipeptide synthetase LanM, partial [Rhodospirillaceae bacterium]